MLSSGLVRWLGRGLHKIFRLSGAEGATVAGNIFLGMCEAPLLVKGYLSGMNKAEIFLVMTSGMATIAGGVMTTYIGSWVVPILFPGNYLPST